MPKPKQISELLGQLLGIVATPPDNIDPRLKEPMRYKQIAVFTKLLFKAMNTLELDQTPALILELSESIVDSLRTSMKNANIDTIQIAQEVARVEAILKMVIDGFYAEVDNDNRE
jgi:hypothetical protein